jgi:hypothetical protein
MDIQMNDDAVRWARQVLAVGFGVGLLIGFGIGLAVAYWVQR